MKISFESGKPLFLQLQELIRTDIAAGKYSPGEKIPGVRDLALGANVNPNTMQRALAELEAEGLLVTRGTSGRFICPDPAVIEEAKRKILAEHANISVYHLSHIFKQSTGQTPIEYLNQYRLIMSADMLKSSDYSIMQIAFECGYNNVSYFNRAFKAKYGITPKEYIK